ncbi:MAG: DUF3483 domain-containing protein, partial [Bdellovibrionales bacterium]|nr:DUF3483 domain-containing protein [Bdellovibrionales bacterium]
MNHSIPTREILWNVSSLANVVLMYAIFALSLVVALNGIWRRAELWKSGKAEDENLGSILNRIKDLFTNALLQKKVVRNKNAAIAHTLIYFGFLVLLFTTTMVLIDHDLGIRIYRGDFYLGITIFSDVFGLGVLIGCVLMAQRRYLQNPDQLHNRLADSLILNSIMLLVVQGFLLEGLRIHVTNDPWALYSPVGFAVAKFFWFLSAKAASLLHFTIWWFHSITVFALIALLPYTKFWHIIASSVNLFFSYKNRPAGALSFPGDIEALMEQGEEFSLGLGNIKDYSWKQLMDLDACTSCGRCQDACPAYNSGKPLSPKWVILDTRNHALALQAKDALADSKSPELLKNLDKKLTTDFFLKSSGLRLSEDGKSFEGKGEFRAKNPLVQNSVLSLGGSADDRIAGTVMDPDVFWSCTTCMACVEACPVGINHVDQIVGNRRNMVLMEGEIPQEAQPTLRALENRANPYGAPEDRINWIGELDVRILEAGDSVDYLYWVGCVSAFDPRKQKIARSLVSLMKAAGLDFGILGTAEGCTGDPARRLGEENLFQALAKSNIETLKSIRFKNIVANCPHCFNTIKNEYPAFGNLGNGQKPRIIHHSKLLQELLEQNKINLKAGSTDKITFHDPCYLGRYNKEYQAPRDTLKAVKSLN